jgi:hypothetical protein
VLVRAADAFLNANAYLKHMLTQFYKRITDEYPHSQIYLEYFIVRLPSVLVWLCHLALTLGLFL